MLGADLVMLLFSNLLLVLFEHDQMCQSVFFSASRMGKSLPENLRELRVLLEEFAAFDPT